ncbi:VOC family protein [Aquicoccus porphyridii]|uniref:VOC family protein n=1 Tax=Aquicoccus porphyridii TaxID=1852029 RepID=A0A5A9ZI17_9RHOB|nr:VOC family protein [Aquicoccus porphyridii]KAA0916622.1 VOC family protein [Aquicoccus porphyridii]RAI53755.1 VOC family protein [Rhodobacteraceae bacterium AsT-22]
MTWKPAGYSSVSPYLIVHDAEATLRFLETVFSATRLRVHPRKDGTGIKHAEARVDDTVIMMGEMPDAGETHVHVYVADAEKTFADAIHAGGQIVQELKRSGDGDYRGGIADGNGAVWWISTQDETEG